MLIQDQILKILEVYFYYKGNIQAKLNYELKKFYKGGKKIMPCMKPRLMWKSKANVNNLLDVLNTIKPINSSPLNKQRPNSKKGLKGFLSRYLFLKI